MTVQLKKTLPAKATPITVVDRAAFQALASSLPDATRAWLATVGFVGAADSHALVPGADGQLARVFAGVAHAAHPFALSHLPLALPEGLYKLDDAGLPLLPPLLSNGHTFFAGGQQIIHPQAEILSQRHLAGLDAVELGIDRVEAVGDVRVDQRALMLEQGLEDMGQHLVRAIAHKHLLRPQAVQRGHCGLERAGLGIGFRQGLSLSLHSQASGDRAHHGLHHEYTAIAFGGFKHVRQG